MLSADLCDRISEHCPGLNPENDNSQMTTCDRGFTLLELIISLTIIAIIVVIISAALRIGTRAWEKGEKDIESNQRQRIVLDLMKRQLASALRERSGDKKKTTFRLKGDDKSLSFLSSLALVPNNTFGTVHVRYRVGPDEKNHERLSFHEENIVLIKDADKGEPDEDAFYELISGMRDISFGYLKQHPEGPEWQDVWDPESDKGVPLAISVSFEKYPGSPSIRVLARIQQDTLSDTR